MYKPAPKQTYFYIHYVYWVALSFATCTFMYKQAPNQTYFSCLCLLGGAFSRNLYFRVQTGTKPNLFLVVYVFWVVLSVATCTFVYKQAPKQTYLTGGLVVYVFGMVLLVANKPILQGFSCLCLGGGMLLVTSCTPEYKQAPYEPQKKYLPIHRLQITVTSLSVQVDLQLPWSSVVWT